MAEPTSDRVPRVSPVMWRWFCSYAHRFVRRHFHALRLSREVGVPTASVDEPLVVYGNHASWWDPMVAIVLAHRLWPDRAHYFPIDARMLEKYRFFTRLGFFGVEPETARGGATFLRTALAIAQTRGACLWIPAQGRFADVRERPVALKPGLAHLARRMDHGVIVPLAGEYPFWTERTPEALLRFGPPLHLAQHRLDTVAQWQDRLTGSLETAMTRLAGHSIARDTGAFEVLVGGRTGTSFAYDAWRRLSAWIGGRSFDPAHMPETRSGEEATPS